MQWQTYLRSGLHRTHLISSLNIYKWINWSWKINGDKINNANNLLTCVNITEGFNDLRSPLVKYFDGCITTPWCQQISISFANVNQVCVFCLDWKIAYYVYSRINCIEKKSNWRQPLLSDIWLYKLRREEDASIILEPNWYLSITRIIFMVRVPPRFSKQFYIMVILLFRITDTVQMISHFSCNRDCTKQISPGPTTEKVGLMSIRGDVTQMYLQWIPQKNKLSLLISGKSQVFPFWLMFHKYG